MKKKSKIVAIIVTFYPKKEEIVSLINSVSSQVDTVLVVDNTPIPFNFKISDFRGFENFFVISLEDNYGIAYAHNIGIEWACKNSADYVLLLDQDSIPSPNMVKKLFDSYSIDDSLSQKIAAIGPSYFDLRTGIGSFFMIEHNKKPYRWKPIVSESYDDFSLEVAFLISSGSLINLSTLKAIGGMSSNYFIDHVDTEWCFRARAKGYVLLGVPSAVMQHSLGDKVSKVWFFGWRHVAYHSPFRDYYMFRNTLLMLRDVKMTVAWRVHLLWRLFIFSSYFLIFASQRCNRFYCMLLGLIHGLRGVSGKVDLKTSKCTQTPISALDS